MLYTYASFLIDILLFYSNNNRKVYKPSSLLKNMSSLLNLREGRKSPETTVSRDNSVTAFQNKGFQSEKERQFSLEETQAIFARAQAYHALEQAREEQERQAEGIAEGLKGSSYILGNSVGESTIYQVGKEVCRI